MPGYCIVTNAYSLGIVPMSETDNSTDGFTTNNVYYTDNTEFNSLIYFHSIIPYKLADNKHQSKVVGVCVGSDIMPEWLTKEEDGTVCYIRRHVKTNGYKKIYTIWPTLYRTKEEAQDAVEDNTFSDIVKANLHKTRL